VLTIVGKVLLKTLILAIFAGCGGVTDTGNPNLQTQNGSSSSPPTADMIASCLDEFQDGECQEGVESFSDVITSDSNKPVETSLQSRRIIYRSCSKLAVCFEEVSIVNCLGALRTSVNFYENLGIPSAAYATYLDFMRAEYQQKFRINKKAVKTCLAQIYNYDCLDPAVQAAYDQRLPDNFSGVQNMIPDSPDSCRDSFEP